MPSSASRKGYSGEREVVHMLRELGWKAKRAFGSDGRSMGTYSDVDIKAKKGDLEILIQVKRRKRFAVYNFFKNSDVVAIRADHKQWLYILTEEMFKSVSHLIKK